MNLHGNIIIYRNSESLDVIPKRNSNIPLDSKILFMPNCVKVIHEKNTDEKYSSFKVMMFGVLLNGVKTAVVLEGFKPYFTIRKPIDIDEKKFREKIERIVSEHGIRNWSMEIIYGKSFQCYEEHKSMYIKLVFTSAWDRGKILKYINTTLHMDTTDDDPNHLERVLCRDSNFSMTSWCVINSYKSYKKESISCIDKIFRADYRNIAEYTGDVAMLRCPAISCNWDIEAFTADRTLRKMPDPKVAEDVVFCVSMTYTLEDSTDSILDVVIVTFQCNPIPGVLIIKCATEADLIKAYADLHSIMQPEFIIGFNDSAFDWTFMVEKADRNNVLEYMYNKMSMYNEPPSRTSQLENIRRWKFMTNNIKIDPETTAYAKTLDIPGSINIDIRTCLRQKFPKTAKTKLSYYLEMSNLGNKLDMPINVMFEHYEESLYLKNAVIDRKNMKEIKTRYINNKIAMSEVALYCVVDAKKCQELIVKYNFIPDAREISNISRTTLFDAFYYAGTMKLKNLVMRAGKARGLMFTLRMNRTHSDEQYPGGHVFTPVRGPGKPKLTFAERKQILTEWKDVPDSEIKIMENAILNDIDIVDKKYISLFNYAKEESNRYPSSCYDCVSLYPSLFITYNFSPEFMIFTPSEYKRMINANYLLHPIDFPCNGTRVKAWTVRHNETANEGGNKTVEMGLYPCIQIDLFQRRSAVKKEMNRCEAVMKKLEEEKKTNTDEYRAAQFTYRYNNTKQSAIKVFMNTFYGETGNKMSPNYILALAGGITAEGRRTIKLVADRAMREGCTLQYGDTDSVFISPPASEFKELDRKYYGGMLDKHTYCTRLVETTIAYSSKIKQKINEALVEDNGTTYINVAYEKTLYPYLYIQCKMYAGIEHVFTTNFNPSVNKLFIKGLAIKRRDASGLLVKICGEVLMSILDIHNINTIEYIVTDKIKEIYKRTWTLEDFKKSAVYNPSKNNVSVGMFRERMRERKNPLCPLPKPSERFDYVVVKKYPFKYDLKGKKSKILIGEQWEYFNYARDNEMEIDLNYYITGGIIGQFAQLLAPNYYIPPGLQEEQVMAEAKSLQMANKFVTGICRSMTEEAKCIGPLLKVLYKKADVVFSSSVNALIKTNNDKKIYRIIASTTGDDIFQQIIKSVEEKCKKSAEIYATDYVNTMKEKHSNNVLYKMLGVIYNKKKTANSLLTIRLKYIDNIIAIERQKINNNMDSIKEFISTKDYTLSNMVERMKHECGIMDNKIDSIDVENIVPVGDIKLDDHVRTVQLINSTYTNIYIAYSFKCNIIAVYEKVKYCIDEDCKVRPIPIAINRNTGRIDAVNSIQKHGLMDF